MLTVALLTFGHGGHTAYFTDARHHVLQGYDRPENWKVDDYEKDPTHPHYNPVDYEGAWVLDLRAAVEKAPALALRSPLVDPTMAPGAIDRCPQPSALMACAMADNEYGGLLALQECHRHGTEKAEPGPLDSLSVPDFVTWWSKHPGTRVGEVVKGSIVWHDRTV